MSKKTAKELKQEVETMTEKLDMQKKARQDLADAVIKGREQKQMRSDNTKRKILIGAYLLKKYDNDVKKFLAENPDFMLIVRETDKGLFV
ncbi:MULTISPECIES: mobilization protein [unclassified Acinetobacter]|uniref:mobilization protein n=1 Tax=unclassified Acinetobacter TaxID=196816 RepID=UPI00124C785C|nr:MULTISPECIES: mobilization protein [unclassified Acinetobacter]